MSFEELVSGHQRGPVAAFARAGLSLAAFVYERGIRVRNAYYDTWAMPVWLDIPVISVGNLTVGGTGKTPMTMWLCERLLARGRKPAVLSRGYKATDETGADELLLISRRVPQAVAVAHADRARAGRLAIAEYQAQAAVLDDGFQHRRLGRDLDLLLIDVTRPFGYDRVLPRGLLREPIGSLCRSDAIILTRCDQASASQLAAVKKEIREWSARVPVVGAVHQFAGFADLQGRPVEAPGTGVRCGCFAGIARPDAFVRTLTDLGYAVLDSVSYPDHHAYSAADAETLAAWAREGRMDTLITTEKDAVKLSRLEIDWPVPVFSAIVHMRMLDDGERVLDDLIDRMLREHEQEAAEREEPDGRGYSA